MFGMLWDKRILKLYGMVEWAGQWKPIGVLLLEDVSKFLEMSGSSHSTLWAC